MLNDVMSKSRLLNPYLYTFSIYFMKIHRSAETEYFSTRSWYRNINFLWDRIRRIFFNSPGQVVCFSEKDDVSRNQNNCYWPLHNESIARCKHHMQEKQVYLLLHIFGKFMILKLKSSHLSLILVLILICHAVGWYTELKNQKFWWRIPERKILI
jgi:hypothetical protein